MTYLITGVDKSGRRFRKSCGQSLNYALSHNVWRGTLWAVLTNGRRVKIHAWSN